MTTLSWSDIRHETTLANRSILWEIARLRIGYSEKNSYLSGDFIKTNFGLWTSFEKDGKNWVKKAYRNNKLANRLASLRFFQVRKGHELVAHYLKNHREVRDGYFGRKSGYLYFDILKMAQIEECGL